MGGFVLHGVIELARTVSALQIAHREGLPLQQRGQRWWVCCPLHKEKTPSLLFYDDGGWHCFGCDAGGDGISFYAALHGLTQGEAARRIIDAFALAGGTASPRPSPRDFVRAARHWRQSQIEKLRALKEQASNTLEAIPQQIPSREAVWDTTAFPDVLYARELIERAIDELQDATEIELYKMMGGENT